MDFLEEWLVRVMGGRSALQLASLKYGNYASLARESKTVLTTADRELANAARAEGLRVWSVLDETPPNEV
jgi:hypothetical protein